MGNPDASNRHIKVVAGIVLNPGQRVLVQRRPSDKPQAGRWEFPGGKLEHAESMLQALQRELLEELGVHVVDATTCLSLSHQYPDVFVELTVLQVSTWYGTPEPLEGQVLKWATEADLRSIDMLEANAPIIEHVASLLSEQQG